MTPTLPWGPELDRWFEQLDAQGFRTGVRERLLVQTLLVRQEADGKLPESLEAALASVASLLCTSAEQQRRYGQLLKEFVTQQGGEVKRSHLAPSRSWIALFVFVMALAAWFGPGLLGPDSQPTVKPLAEQPIASPGPAAAASSPGMVVPALPLPVEPGGLHPIAAAARPVLVGIATLAGLALLWASWIRHRRRIILKNVPTEDEVEQHFFHENDPLGLTPHVSVLRPVSIALRQRVAGETSVVDIAATLRATAATLGALSPRWRQVRRTPEYLVLVDTRHPSDLLAACGHALVAELVRLGVTMHVYGFDGSPAGGCWVHGAVGNDDVATRRRIPFSVMATRHQNQRLFIIGNADAAMLGPKGGPQPWVQSVSLLAERVWLTPQPLATWGAAEFAADDAGFLVLPLQESALPTLASWLTSGRLALEQSPDDPRSYPRLLCGSELEWVIRSDPPPPEVSRELLAQVRSMLGGIRFQWFCACAAFPALTPPLTSTFGKLVLPDDAVAVRQGMPVLAALPWFRYGRMPEWLRKELLGQLAPDFRRALIDEVDRRLDAALAAGNGQEVARIATRLERRAWALRHRVGPLQDVVLAEFLSNAQTESVSEAGEKLRKRLFRGRDERDWRWRPLPLAAGLLCLAAGVVALSPLWNTLFAAGPQVAELPQRILLAEAGWREGASQQARLAAASENLVVIVADALPPMAADFARARPRAQVLFNGADASFFEQGAALSAKTEAGELRVANGGLELSLTGGQGSTALLPAGSGVLAAGFTPSGGRIVALTGDGSLRTWGTPWPSRSVAVVDCSASDIQDASRLANRLAQRRPVGEIAVSAFQRAWWARMSGLQMPPPAVVQVWDTANETFALELSQWAGTALGTSFAVQPSIPGSNPLPAAAIGVCSRATTVLSQQPGARSEPTIDQRVEQMFAADREARVQATDNLRKDAAVHAAAVPLALRRAMVAQRARGAPSELDGVINTLVLLKFVPESVLRTNARAIQALLDSAEKNGKQTAAHVRDVRLRLAKAVPQSAPPPSAAASAAPPAAASAAAPTASVPAAPLAVESRPPAEPPSPPQTQAPPSPTASIDEAALRQIRVMPTREGLDLIAKYEGLSASPDRSGVIGYGHMLTSEERKMGAIRIGNASIPINRPMDERTARTVLAFDLQRTYSLIAQRVQVPLTPYQRDALASYVYNVGPRVLSDAWLTELNMGNYDVVPESLTGAGGDSSRAFLRGLVQRRQEEAALWRKRD